MNATFTVYEKNISFSDKEMQIFHENGLTLSNQMLELLLHWNNIDTLDGKTFTECHDYCINAIINYSKRLFDTLTTAKKDGVL